MITKNFGDFQDLEDSNTTGTQTASDMPPIAGSPMPNSGIRNKTMGNVFPDKDDPSPKQFSGRQAASKRMKGLPSRSPLGPITGGQSPKPQRPNPGQQPGQQQDVNPGDRWMGELWQGLTLNEQPQGGFAMGGAVGGSSAPNPGMDLYNQATQELESGGVSGYAQGGMVEQPGDSDLVGQSREIASKGRYGDSMLMHINPAELGGLQSLLGPVTINPETGNPEAFAWLAAMIPALTAATAATAVPAAVTAAGTGLAVGATAAAATAATAATAAAAIPTAAAAIPTVAAAAPTGLAAGNAALPLFGVPQAAAGGTLAPGGGVLAIGGGGGVSAAEAAALGVANTTQGTALAGQLGAGFQPAATGGISKSALAKAAAQGISSLSSQGQQEQTPMGPAPAPPPPPSPQGRVPSPYDRMRKQQGGLGSLPGSRSII